MFELQSIKRKLSKLELSDNGEYPCYSSDNNGIIGYTDNPEFLISESIPCYVIFGDHTRTFHIASHSFGVLDNVKVLKPIVNDTNCLLYIFAKWKKQIPNQGYSRHWSFAKQCEILLPVTPSGEPDYDLMTKFITAIEKIVIAEVIEYKDKILSETKKIVDAS